MATQAADFLSLRNNPHRLGWPCPKRRPSPTLPAPAPPLRSRRCVTPYPILLPLLLLLPACTTPPPAWKAWQHHRLTPGHITLPPHPVEIPLLQSPDGLLFAQTRVAGQLLTLNLDTGYPQLHLDTTFAHQHHIPLLPCDYAGQFDGGRFPFSVGTLPDVTLGPASAQQVSATFSDLSAWRTQHPLDPAHPVDGILGGALLPAWGAQIDFQHRRLLLGPTAPPTDALVVNLIPRDCGRLYVEAYLQSRRLCLLIDTGANATILDQSLANLPGVTPLPDTGTLSFLGAQYPIRALRIPHLRLATVTLTDVKVAAMDLSIWRRDESQTAGRPIDGILGTDLLSSLRATIDYTRPALLLPTPSTKPSHP